MAAELEHREVTLHGHRIAYVQAGSGPVILLIHGITSSSENWRLVLPSLASRFTVIAPISSVTANRTSQGATIRWAPTRAACAIC
jgi:hypothetical protein